MTVMAIVCFAAFLSLPVAILTAAWLMDHTCTHRVWESMPHDPDRDGGTVIVRCRSCGQIRATTGENR